MDKASVEAMAARVGIRTGKGVGPGIAVKRNRPVVRQGDLRPAGMVVITRRRADGVGVFVKAKAVEHVQRVFKGEKPVMIESDFLHADLLKGELIQ